jgi:hypothetical protein
MVTKNSLNNIPDANRTAKSLPVFSTGGALAELGPLTNGQLLIGNTGNNPSAATLTQGTAMTITNAAGSITVATPAITQVVIQTFTSGGTYTPTTGMKYCVIEIIGGGGAGGGAAVTGASTVSVGAGGGAGEYARGVFSAATIGASQTVTIGTAGSGSSGAAGGDGGDSSVGAVITAKGGKGGNIGGTAGNSNCNGGLGGTGGSGGSFRAPGEVGETGYANFSTGVVELTAGQGGSSQYGSGGTVDVTAAANQGSAALGYGSGGGGSSNYINQGATLAGGNGTAGIVIITEYVNA